MAFWKKQAQYDACEKACYTEPSLGGIPAYSFAEAVRAVVDAPRPALGPKMLLLAEEDSLVNPEELPDNITVVYYSAAARTPDLLGAGY
jgi:hypothetical protein